MPVTALKHEPSGILAWISVGEHADKPNNGDPNNGTEVFGWRIATFSVVSLHQKPEKCVQMIDLLFSVIELRTIISETRRQFA
jgi:hypothetical protein